jgi:hypothetical protein
MEAPLSGNQDSWAGAREVWETGDRLIPIIRISLALTAQPIVFVHPGESLYRSAVLSVVLGLYALYSIGLYFRIERDDRVGLNLKAWIHWIDVAWCLVLISLSRGGHSIFFIGLLFPMIVAALGWGFISGLRVTIVSVLLFAVVGAAFLPRLEAGLELDLVLLKSAWLLGGI